MWGTMSVLASSLSLGMMRHPLNASYRHTEKVPAHSNCRCLPFYNCFKTISSQVKLFFYAKYIHICGLVSIVAVQE